MAIAALVCAFVCAPLGIVFGHVSLAQLKRTGEQGRGLAVAGLVIGYVLTATAMLAVAALVVLVALAVRFGDVRGWAPTTPDGPVTQLSTTTLPPFRAPATLGSNCQYPATAEPATRPVAPPPAGRTPTTPATIAAQLDTDAGVVGLRLDNAKAPCTVNSFTSLARQGFYDGTRCHRLATSPVLGLLQCGDPSGTGTGGPGYRFPNEYPTNQYRLSDPALTQPVRYPRGTLAMANVGPGTNGSQFLLVYADSALPPTYTAFGTIDAPGLAIVERIAAEGVRDGSEGVRDGAPRRDLTIETVRAG